MTWPQFIRLLLCATIAIGSALYAFILVLDPYQNVPFSPDLSRAPVSTNQRFAFPALARDARFDSAVIGTSAVRPLDPARLGAALDAHFVNLAMNSATAYEQGRMHEIFLRHHPQPRYLVLGMDGTWCSRAKRIDRYTFRDFPEWMFDDDQWNDLFYLFNDKALENAARMLELLIGTREPKYRRDGYRDFTLDFGAFDADAVTNRLYEDGNRDYRDAQILASLNHPEWHYPLAESLRDLVQRTPDSSRWALVFLPLHGRYVAKLADNMAECKARIVRLFSDMDNVAVLDYLYVSALTRTDANYWDAVHFRDPVARQLEHDITSVFAGHAPASEFARVLRPLDTAASRP